MRPWRARPSLRRKPWDSDKAEWDDSAVTSQAWVEYEAHWRTALEALRTDGWTVEMVTSAGPVQLEGRVPSGERFYFRARGTRVLLAVGGDDPGDAAPWEQEVSYGADPFAASYLPGEVALGILRTLFAQFSR